MTGDPQNGIMLCTGWAILGPDNRGVMVERTETGALCVYGTLVEAQAALRAQPKGVGEVVPVEVMRRLT